jgi:hypothetical protein
MCFGKSVGITIEDGAHPDHQSLVAAKGHPMLSPKGLKQRLVDVFYESNAGTSNTNAFDRLSPTARN